MMLIPGLKARSMKLLEVFIKFPLIVKYLSGQSGLHVLNNVEMARKQDKNQF